MGIKVLIAMRGFEEPQVKEIMENLNERGAGIGSIATVHTKIGVLQACSEDPGIRVAIISEYLESGFPYKTEEFDEIDSIREELKVIPILMDTHRGKKFAEELHAQAIYNAVFESDADMAFMAELIKNGRNKKAARLYYCIHKETFHGQDMPCAYASPKETESCLMHVIDGGPRTEFAKRLAYVEERLPAQDFRFLLSKLPIEYLEEAKGNVEFRKHFITETVPSIEMAEKKPRREAPEKPFRAGIQAAMREHGGKEKSIPGGTMEIGICAAGHGVGATYTAILCANALSHDYKVAFVEQNESGHMSCLMEKLTGDKGQNARGGIFSYGGVDYYFGMDYLRFAMDYRNKYDFVAIDFGVLERDADMREFCRMDRHFLIIPETLWRRGDIYHYLSQTEDGCRATDIAYLAPFHISSSLRRELDIACPAGEIHAIGFAEDAFSPSEQHKDLFYRLCCAKGKETPDSLFARIMERTFRHGSRRGKPAGNHAG